MTEHLLTNAAIASALAALVYVAATQLKSSAVAHLLWVVVLLRFIAPPLYLVPLWPSSLIDSRQQVPAGTHNTGLAATTHSEASAAPLSDHIPLAILWQLIHVVWMTGALVVLTSAIWRTLRLQSLIDRYGQTDATTSERVEQIARESGVRKIPKVLLVRARISPMVWGVGRCPMLLLPAELWIDLSRVEQDAILSHELAHLRRRDHWVRLLEFAATVTHWWCPFLWWARHELHRHEERCCDSWAAASGDIARAALAQACIRTIDFVGGAQSRSFEFGVSRMAGYQPIRDRLQFILNGAVAQNLNHRISSMAMMAIVGVVALMFSPDIAKSSEKQESTQRPTGNTSAQELRVHQGQLLTPTRSNANVDAFTRTKVWAFERLTGIDLEDAVVKEVRGSLMDVMDDTQMPSDVREEIKRHLPESLAELQELARRSGDEKISLYEFARLIDVDLAKSVPEAEYP